MDNLNNNHEDKKSARIEDIANQTEQHLKEYSEELIKKVQKNPLSAVLIAGAAGFILASLLK